MIIMGTSLSINRKIPYELWDPYFFVVEYPINVQRLFLLMFDYTEITQTRKLVRFFLVTLATNLIPVNQTTGIYIYENTTL